MLFFIILVVSFIGLGFLSVGYFRFKKIQKIVEDESDQIDETDEIDEELKRMWDSANRLVLIGAILCVGASVLNIILHILKAPFL